MFLRRGKRGSTGGIPPMGDSGAEQAAQRQTQQLEDWRRSAQRVTRAWNAWLAADGRDRAARYGAFVVALAEEERAAAEVRRMIEHSEAVQDDAVTRSGR